MDYLWWYVPGATAPMWIALVATIHVLVSHYAVGGGIFLAWETTFAHRTKNEAYRAYLHQHAFFFIMVTVVFGAVTGVGIWWTIGLASPLATELLIRTFVFAWATEWVFFFVELAAAFLFFYRWDQVSRSVHLAYGWIYAICAWASLVLITSVTAFMLDPGNWVEATKAGTGEPHFWLAFFNPQFLPQTLYRTGMALLLTVAYVIFHATFFLREEALRNFVLRRSARFFVVGFVLALAGVCWMGWALPMLAKMTLFRAAVPQLLGALMLGGFVALAGLVGMLTWKPQWGTPLAGLAILGLAFCVLAAGEFVREAIRKPYIVMNTIQGNQISVGAVSRLRENGLLESGTWTKRFMTTRFPETVGADGKLDLTRVAEKDRVAVGEVIFMHHCNDCHDAGHGYAGVGPLATARTRDGLVQFVKNLDAMVYYMPPWCGNETEAELLVDYLRQAAPAYPAPALAPALDESGR